MPMERDNCRVQQQQGVLVSSGAWLWRWVAVGGAGSGCCGAGQRICSRCGRIEAAAGESDAVHCVHCVHCSGHRSGATATATATATAGGASSRWWWRRRMAAIAAAAGDEADAGVGVERPWREGVEDGGRRIRKRLIWRGPGREPDVLEEPASPAPPAAAGGARAPGRWTTGAVFTAGLALFGLGFGFSLSRAPKSDKALMREAMAVGVSSGLELSHSLSHSLSTSHTQCLN